MTAYKVTDSQLTRLEDWYRSPLGNEVAARECDCLTEMLGDLFGYYLVQVGVTDRFRDVITTCRIRNRVLVHCGGPSGQPGLEMVGHPERLPIASDEIDAVLLPHILDFAPDPRQVLREVERVLIPEGRVFILGFNALSSWGLRAALHRMGGCGRQRVPWCGRFLTPYRVEDWLSLLGFDVEMREHIVFMPPFRRALDSRLSALDRLGRRFWPALGGVYVIRAVKRVSTLTPLKPSWAPRRTLVPGGAIEPSARGGLSSEGRNAAMSATPGRAGR